MTLLFLLLFDPRPDQKRLFSLQNSRLLVCLYFTHVTHCLMLNTQSVHKRKIPLHMAQDKKISIKKLSCTVREIELNSAKCYCTVLGYGCLRPAVLVGPAPPTPGPCDLSR